MYSLRFHLGLDWHNAVNVHFTCSKGQKLFPFQMYIALRYFATGANYSVIGNFAGGHKSMVSHCLWEISYFFYCRQKDYIIFPTTREARREKAGFFLRWVRAHTIFVQSCCWDSYSHTLSYQKPCRILKSERILV